MNKQADACWRMFEQTGMLTMYMLYRSFLPR